MSVDPHKAAEISATVALAGATRAALRLADRAYRQELNSHDANRGKMGIERAKRLAVMFNLRKVLGELLRRLRSDLGGSLPRAHYPSNTWQPFASIASWSFVYSQPDVAIRARPRRPLRPKERWLKPWRAESSVDWNGDNTIELLAAVARKNSKASREACDTALEDSWRNSASSITGLRTPNLVFRALALVVEIGVPCYVGDDDVRKVSRVLAQGTRVALQPEISTLLHSLSAARRNRLSACGVDELANKAALEVQIQLEGDAEESPLRIASKSSLMVPADQVLAALTSPSWSAFEAAVHEIGLDLEEQLFILCRSAGYSAGRVGHLRKHAWFTRFGRQSINAQWLIDAILVRLSQTESRKLLKSLSRPRLARVTRDEVQNAFGRAHIWDGAWGIERWRLPTAVDNGDALIRWNDAPQLLGVDRERLEDLDWPDQSPEAVAVVVRDMQAWSDGGAQYNLERHVTSALDLWSILAPPRGQVVRTRDSIRVRPADQMLSTQWRDGTDSWRFNDDEKKKFDKAQSAIRNAPIDLKRRVVTGAAYFHAATVPTLPPAVAYSFLWLALEAAVGSPSSDTSLSPLGKSRRDRDSKEAKGERVARRAARLIPPERRFRGLTYHSAREVISADLLRLYGIRNRAFHEGEQEASYNSPFFSAMKRRVRCVLITLYLAGVVRRLQSLEQVLAWNEEVAPGNAKV